MLEKLKDLGRELENNSIKCTIYYKHDLDQLEEENIEVPNSNIIFVNNEMVKIFFNCKSGKVEMETTEARIKIDSDSLNKLSLLNSIVEKYNK